MKFSCVPNSAAYYLNLHLKNVFYKIKYRWGESTIVYAIRCQVNVYIGSTSVPADRLYSHFYKPYKSNVRLQADIAKYGLSKFTLYIFEEVIFPSGLTAYQKRTWLLTREQSYIDDFPLNQTYNSIRSSR